MGSAVLQCSIENRLQICVRHRKLPHNQRHQFYPRKKNQERHPTDKLVWPYTYIMNSCLLDRPRRREGQDESVTDGELDWELFKVQDLIEYVMLELTINDAMSAFSPELNWAMWIQKNTKFWGETGLQGVLGRGWGPGVRSCHAIEFALNLQKNVGTTGRF